MALLPAYEARAARRRGRSLIQYYGCHSMSLRWKWSGKVYFVVMRNFLPVRSWLTFDLKGATANRRALAAKFLHQIHAGADPRGGAAYGTLRDWEWLDIAMHIDVPDAAKAELAETLQADAAFLAEQGLLDYSLLVGIHRLPPSMPPAQREARVEALAAQGGYVSRDRQKVYFFGIIDVLETYSLRWQAQRAALTAGYYALCRGAEPDGISAMTPDDYADRFYTFVLHEVLARRRRRARTRPGPSAARAARSRRTGGGRTLGSGGGAASCRSGSSGEGRPDAKDRGARGGVEGGEGARAARDMSAAGARRKIVAEALASTVRRGAGDRRVRARRAARRRSPRGPEPCRRRHHSCFHYTQ